MARFTLEGYQEKLQQLNDINERLARHRKNVPKAVSSGEDLRENKEFQDAILELQRLEGVRQKLQKEIEEAEIISSPSAAKIQIGSRVQLCNLRTNEVEEYILVDPAEADVEKGKISTLSPCGKALIGKSGGVVSFKSPRGKMQYRIIKFF